MTAARRASGQQASSRPHEQLEPLGVGAALDGGVHDQHRAGSARQRVGVPVQVQLSDQGVVHAHPAAGRLPDVVAGPQRRELVAAHSEFANQLRGARVPRIGGDLGAQHRGQLGDGGGPLRAGLVGFRVQQERQQVPLRHGESGEVAQQRPGLGAPGQYVQVAAHDQCGRGHRTQQPLCGVRYLLRFVPARGAGRGARGGGEAVQVPGLLGGEVQGAREGVQNLFGGPHVAPLLHPLVIVRTHPRQQGQFLPPQPGDSPPRAGFEADVLRPQPGPAGPQERGEFTAGLVGRSQGVVGHGASMPRAPLTRVGLPVPGKGGRP